MLRGNQSLISFLNAPILAFMLAAYISLASTAQACPKIGNLIDYNCDQKITMGFFGDSITYGVGDIKYSATRGGYPQRLQRTFSNATIVKLAKPGTTAQGLYRLLHKRTSREALESGIDYGVILVGANDYWEENSIEEVLNTIQRTMTYLKSFGMYVSVATPTTTKRGYQREYIEALQAQISSRYPTHVHFDTVDITGIGWDGLHPSATGYREMGLIARRFIRGPLQTLLQAARKDLDEDGVYDRFEVNKFLTDPDKEDTDGDGLLDGEEIFSYLTDPRAVDTDGDTVSDGDEVAGNRNPLDPAN